jgi:HNH endonuclease
MAKRARGMALGPEAQRTRPTVGLLQLDRRYTATGDAPHDLDQRSCPESPTPRFDPHPNAARRRRHRPRIRHRPRGVACRLFSDGRGGRGIGRRRAVRTAARRCQRDNRQERRHTSIRHGCHSRLRSRRCHQRSPAELVAKVRTERRHNGHLSAATLERLTCDCDISRVVTAGRSEVLDVGRATRTITPAIWKALVVRDQHCQAVGCDRPPDTCQAHHIVHWTRGGPTNLQNLQLLCWHHHRHRHTNDAQARAA